MKKIVSLGLLVVLVAVAGGCKKEIPAPGVGVVDVDRVADAMGWSGDFQNALKGKEESLQKQLEQVKANFQTQISEKTSAIDVDATDDQKQELAQLTNQANRLLQNAVNDARQKSTQFRVELITKLRDQVKPYVQTVADEKGIGVVFFKTEPVYYTSTTADLTSDVIAKLRAANATFTVATPAPVPETEVAE